MNNYLKTNQIKLLTLAATLVFVLTIAVGYVVLQLNHQATVARQAVPSPDSNGSIPRIVTNTPTQTSTTTPTPTPTNTPAPTATPTPIVVITHVKDLGRLEAVEFTMQTVVDLENEPTNLWERVVGSDKLMLIAEGEVVAGFDLAEVTAEDITVSGQSVEIVLPAPEILYSRIDNERTQVYERETGLFVKPDPSLEGRARQLAEEALVDWAIERDIFDKAEQTGKLRLENLLRSLGFTEIEIIVEGKEL